MYVYVCVYAYAYIYIYIYNVCMCIIYIYIYIFVARLRLSACCFCVWVFCFLVLCHVCLSVCIIWLRTNGVNTSGAAAKVMNKIMPVRPSEVHNFSTEIGRVAFCRSG